MNDFEPFEPPVDLAALDRMLDAVRSRANHPTARPVEAMAAVPAKRLASLMWRERYPWRATWKRWVRRVREVVYVARHGMTQGDDW